VGGASPLGGVSVAAVASGVTPARARASSALEGCAAAGGVRAEHHQKLHGVCSLWQGRWRTTTRCGLLLVEILTPLLLDELGVDALALLTEEHALEPRDLSLCVSEAGLELADAGRGAAEAGLELADLVLE
jgi:hypothetical protein